MVYRVWQHAPATAAYPQSWGNVPMLHYGVRRSVLVNLDLEVRVCFQQSLLHCPKEPSADSLIPSNQSTTFIQTFISCHLDQDRQFGERSELCCHRPRQMLLYCLLQRTIIRDAVYIFGGSLPKGRSHFSWFRLSPSFLRIASELAAGEPLQLLTGNSFIQIYNQ